MIGRMRTADENRDTHDRMRTGTPMIGKAGRESRDTHLVGVPNSLLPNLLIPASRSAGLSILPRSLRIRKYGHDNLLDDIWALRDSLTAHAAAQRCGPPA